MPPLPDHRRVVLETEENVLELPGWLGKANSAQEKFGVPVAHKEEEKKIQALKPLISNLNTTLIGDYIAVVFPEYHQHWLVQAVGNATFQSVTKAVTQDELIVNRKNIFVQLGGNQIRSATRSVVFRSVFELVAVIKQKNTDCKIYLVGVLPRPIENDQVCKQVMMYNRWLWNTAERIWKIFGEIIFLPAQLKFIGSNGPRMELFNMDDKLTLNQAGVKLLKAILFQLAGFVKNQS